MIVQYSKLLKYLMMEILIIFDAMEGELRTLNN